MKGDKEEASGLLNRENSTVIAPSGVTVLTSLTGNSISTNKRCEVLLATALVDS